MKRTFVIVLLVCLASVLSGILTNAQALDVNALYTTLKSELGNSGVAAADLSAAESPIKSMLGMGASLADTKKVLLDFASKGFKGNNFSSLVTLVSELMKNGEAIKGASGFVSSAIGQAKSLGLKDQGLMAKVKSLVSQKIAALDLLKSKAAAASSQGKSLQDTVNKEKASIGSLFGK